MKNNTLNTRRKLTLAVSFSSNFAQFLQLAFKNHIAFCSTFQIIVLLSLLALAKCSPLDTTQSISSAAKYYRQFEEDQPQQENFVHLYPNGTFDPDECSTDQDCTKYDKAMCKENQCYCKTNHRFERRQSDGNITCAFFRCRDDSQCQDWDPNMTCTSEQTCSCRRDFFSSHYDRKCVQMATGFNWLLYLAIIPILLVVALSVYLCIRLGRSSSKSLRERATNFKRRMSRKLSVIAGVGASKSASDSNNNNNTASISKGNANGKLPQSFTQTDM